MSRIPTPASIESSPSASRPLLEAVQKQLGVVPNLFRLVGNSPAGLEGLLALNGALAKGRLGARTREGIALTVAEANGCDYCLSAHTYLGTNVAKMDDAEIAANREGGSRDPKNAAAIRFARRIAETRGQIAEEDLAAVKAAGFGDAEIVEIVLVVALNFLTNLVNNALGTDIDFPHVHHRAA
jgi:uncharacterized peroxidase-related enzyme